MIAAAVASQFGVVERVGGVFSVCRVLLEVEGRSEWSWVAKKVLLAAVSLRKRPSYHTENERSDECTAV